MRGRAGRRGATLLALSATSALALVASACGASVPLSPPTGIDELVVPTPSPSPDDFVVGVDNPWLAWEPGATTIYRQTGDVGQDPRDVTVTISSQTISVAGLRATSMTTVDPGPGGTTVDWFAQDLGGNVWWLGRAGQWTAGEAGARAGLWMPAAPRVGDGFRQALKPGVVEDVAEVAVDDDADGQLQVDVRSALVPGVLVERTYDEGRGLVSELRGGVTQDSYLRTLQED